MRYKIRQKIFSFGDNFTIKDMNDNDRFVVKGKVFSLGNKLCIFDMLGNEQVYIEQELLRLLPRYKIYENGIQRASVKKEFTFFKPKFLIESPEGTYNMEGDVFSHDFRINRNGRTVAQVSKAWLSLTDSYGVEIDDNENQAFVLALVIVIDQVLHDGDK